MAWTVVVSIAGRSLSQRKGNPRVETRRGVEEERGPGKMWLSLKKGGGHEDAHKDKQEGR